MSVRVSVAMAVYNGERYLKQQMDSVLCQLGANDEIIISYNQSTDDTLKIISEYASLDERVHVYRCAEKGVNANFENAIRMSHGMYILLCDQDDVWMPDKISVICDTFEKTGADLILHDCFITDKELDHDGGDTLFAKRRAGRGLVRNIVKCAYHGCCMSFDSSIKDMVLPIPRSSFYHDFWIGIMCEHEHKNIVMLDKKLVLYRRHEDNSSGRKGRTLGKIIRERAELVRDMVIRSRMIKRSEGQSLLENSIANMLLKIFGILFPMLSVFWVSHILLSDGVGKVSFAQNIVSYFLLIASLGIPSYGVRTVAQAGGDEHKRASVSASLMTINAVSTVVCMIAYYMMIFGCGFFSSDRKLYLIIGSLLPAALMKCDWYFEGREEYGFIAFKKMATGLLLFLMTVIFVRSADRYCLYAFFIVASTALCNMIGFLKMILDERYSIRYIRISIIKHMRPILILLTSTVSIEIYTMLDSTMVGIFCGNSAVGYYTDASNLVRGIYTVAAAFGAAFYPRLSRYIMSDDKGKAEELVNRAFLITMFIAVPAFIGIFLTADYVVPALFGSSFLPAVATVKILSPLVVILSLAYVIGHGVLLSSGSEDHILRAALTGAVCNVILNLVMIPRYAQNGAAAASVITETIVTVILLRGALGIVRLGISRKFIVSQTISVSVMAFVICAVRYLIEKNTVIKTDSVMGLVILMAAGILSYTVAVFAARHPAIEVIRRMKEE